MWHWFQQNYTSADGSPLPRCNQESYYISYQGGPSRCGADQVVNPLNAVNIIENAELSKATAYSEAVQVKPQRVSLKLRISTIKTCPLLDGRINRSVFQMRLTILMCSMHKQRIIPLIFTT